MSNSFDITLSTGMQITLISAKKPPPLSVPTITPYEQRANSSADAFATLLHNKADGPLAFKSVLLQNHRGSWIIPAAHCINLGVSQLFVWQPARTDIATTPVRAAMVPEEFDLTFVPNYKCGYSSLYTFLCNEFPSCKTRAEQAAWKSAALNDNVDVSSPGKGLRISIVRHPVDRFESFYIDKFCRDETHPNHIEFVAPYRTLLGGTLSPWTVLEFISSIPPSFADPHWLPTSSNIALNGEPLVDWVYDLADADGLANDLSELLRRKVTFPHKLQSGALPASEERALIRSPDFGRAVLGSYRADYELYKQASKGRITSPFSLSERHPHT